MHEKANKLKLRNSICFEQRRFEWGGNKQWFAACTYVFRYIIWIGKVTKRTLLGRAAQVVIAGSGPVACIRKARFVFSLLHPRELQNKGSNSEHRQEEPGTDRKQRHQIKLSPGATKLGIGTMSGCNRPRMDMRLQ